MVDIPSVLICFDVACLVISIDACLNIIRMIQPSPGKLSSTCCYWAGQLFPGQPPSPSLAPFPYAHMFVRMYTCMYGFCMYINTYSYIYIYAYGQNYISKSMPCTNQGRPLSVVRISGFPEVSQTGYRYRVVPYRLWRFCATSERPMRSKD